MLTPRDASRECILSPPMGAMGLWASKARMTVDPWALGQPLPGSGYSTWAHGTLPGGEIQPRGGSLGGRPPWPPLNLGFFFSISAGKFAGSLGLIACKLITSFPYSSM